METPRRVMPTPAPGACTEPEGQVERDEVVMIEAVTDTFDARRGAHMQKSSPSGFSATHIRVLPAETR
jgi:hypothetical protein